MGFSKGLVQGTRVEPDLLSRNPHFNPFGSNAQVQTPEIPLPGAINGVWGTVARCPEGRLRDDDAP